jgi:hypothetical protein
LSGANLTLHELLPLPHRNNALPQLSFSLVLESRFDIVIASIMKVCAEGATLKFAFGKICHPNPTARFSLLLAWHRRCDEKP